MERNRKQAVADALVGCSYSEWCEIRDSVDTQYREASATVCLTEADASQICQVKARDGLDRLVEAVGTAMCGKLEEAANLIC